VRRIGSSDRGPERTKLILDVDLLPLLTNEDHPIDGVFLIKNSELAPHVAKVVNPQRDLQIKDYPIGQGIGL
jgi:hypothetical protein